MANQKMVFKTPKPTNKGNSPVIRLTPSVSSRINEKVEETGLTPSQIIEQMLDFIGDNYEVR